MDDKNGSLGKHLKFGLPYVIAAALVIIAVGIYMRSGMLQFTGFFEPDGFFHYSIIEQAVANNFAVPLLSQYSGFPPVHNGVSEPEGLYYITLIPYSLLQYLGVSAYTIQRMIPLAFSVVELILAYFIVQHLSKSRALGLLAMLTLALSGGDAARTSALVYRGDSFITTFMLLSVLFMLKAIDAGGSRRKYLYAALSPIALGLGAAVWNGSPFTIIVYVLAVVLLEVYAFIRADIKLTKDAVLLGAALIIEYALQRAFTALNIIRQEQAFSSPYFFLFYLPMVLGGLLFYYILRTRGAAPLFSTVRNRSLFVGTICLVVVLAIVGGFYSYLYDIAVNNGGVINPGNQLAATVQELQAPTLPYLWVSFSLGLFLAPLAFIFIAFHGRWKIAAALSVATVLLYIATYYTGYMSAYALFWLGIVVGGISLIGLLSSRHEEAGLLRSAALIVLLAYFIVTFYLQSNAVRYNAIFGAPVAILAAYALYTIGRAVVALAGRRAAAFRPAYAYASIAVLGIIALYFLASTTYSQRLAEGQADGINPQFLDAATWIKNNTPANSTFLTVWPDGSVIEGWGERQSFTDSVGGQSNPRTYDFAVWLFNRTNDATYLEKVRPDYLLVRGFWFVESAGIAIEGNLTNMTDYGFVELQPQQPQYDQSANANRFTFSAYPYSAYMLINSSAAGNRIAAYISYAGSQYLPLNKVLLYNNINGTYSSINITNAGVNYTLLVGYEIKGGRIVVDNAELLASKLPETNFFKLIALCSSVQCPYNNNRVTLTEAFVNSDSKIFRVNYNAG